MIGPSLLKEVPTNISSHKRKQNSNEGTTAYGEKNFVITIDGKLENKDFQQNSGKENMADFLVQSNKIDDHSYTGCFQNKETLCDNEFVEVFSPTVFETVEVYSSDFDLFEPTEANNPKSPTESNSKLNSQRMSTFELLEAEIASIARDYEAQNPVSENITSIDGGILESEGDILENRVDNLEINNVLNCINDTDGGSIIKIPHERQLRSKDRNKTLKSRTTESNSRDSKRSYRTNFNQLSKNARSKIIPSRITSSKSSPKSMSVLSNDVNKKIIDASVVVDPRPIPKSNTTDLPNEEENNLSWLIDFKVSSIFNPADSILKQAPREEKRMEVLKKPRFTYTELIEQALKENGELTVSGIYKWISTNYPYFKPYDFKWKNSVRHNLSINPQFRKGKKASQGAGHYWTINEGVFENNESFQVNVNTPLNTVVTENLNTSLVLEVVDNIEGEILAATRSIQEGENEMEITDLSLQQAAEDVLSGIGREVEVQYMDDSNTTSISADTGTGNTNDDMADFWNTFDGDDDNTYSTLSPLLRHMTAENPIWDDESFQHSICLGDEFFPDLNSPYSLTTI